MFFFNLSLQGCMIVMFLYLLRTIIWHGNKPKLKYNQIHKTNVSMPNTKMMANINKVVPFQDIFACAIFSNISYEDPDTFLKEMVNAVKKHKLQINGADHNVISTDPNEMPKTTTEEKLTLSDMNRIDIPYLPNRQTRIVFINAAKIYENQNEPSEPAAASAADHRDIKQPHDKTEQPNPNDNNGNPISSSFSASPGFYKKPSLELPQQQPQQSFVAPAASITSKPLSKQVPKLNMSKIRNELLIIDDTVEATKKCDTDRVVYHHHTSSGSGSVCCSINGGGLSSEKVLSSSGNSYLLQNIEIKNIESPRNMKYLSILEDCCGGNHSNRNGSGSRIQALLPCIRKNENDQDTPLSSSNISEDEDLFLEHQQQQQPHHHDQRISHKCQNELLLLSSSSSSLYDSSSSINDNISNDETSCCASDALSSADEVLKDNNVFTDSNYYHANFFSKEDTQLYVWDTGYDDGVMIVVFRGTEDILDIRSDLDVRMNSNIFHAVSQNKSSSSSSSDSETKDTTATASAAAATDPASTNVNRDNMLLYDKSSIKIHQGFYSQFIVIADELTEQIKKRLHYCHTVVFCGHSLGGALATIASYYYALMKLKYKPSAGSAAAASLSIKCRTFGSPRVGNEVFVKSYESLIKDHWRVYNYCDLVPMVPMSFRFDHINQKCLCVSEYDCYDYNQGRECHWMLRPFLCLASIRWLNVIGPHSSTLYMELLSKCCHHRMNDEDDDNSSSSVSSIDTNTIDDSS